MNEWDTRLIFLCANVSKLKATNSTDVSTRYSRSGTRGRFLFNNGFHLSRLANGTPWCAQFISRHFTSACLGMRAFICCPKSYSLFFYSIFVVCLKVFCFNGRRTLFRYVSTYSLVTESKYLQHNFCSLYLHKYK